jgi:NAD(P)-dependent dehydrogenase (short-subunit alcohol dehydrogenase family)
MTGLFAGKVALITGAGSGIGLATARAFTEAGATVALADLDQDAAARGARELIDDGHRAIAMGCDVTDEGDAATAVERTVTQLGGLDVAFNSAGIHAPVADAADARGEDFDRVLAVNLRGVFNCMKHQLRHMRSQGRGAIVNCSSQSGIVGTPGLGAYTASKHAVIGLTKSAALDYAGRGIQINAICPGSTDTPMVAQAMIDDPATMQAAIEAIPLHRLGRPEEIAAAVLWLCSPGAAFMVGQALVTDGGYTVG